MVSRTGRRVHDATASAVRRRFNSVITLFRSSCARGDLPVVNAHSTDGFGSEISSESTATLVSSHEQTSF